MRLYKTIYTSLAFRGNRAYEGYVIQNSFNNYYVSGLKLLGYDNDRGDKNYYI